MYAIEDMAKSVVGTLQQHAKWGALTSLLVGAGQTHLFEGWDLAEEDKVEAFFDQIQKLENYELTTETQTRQVAEERTVKVPKKVERKTVPTREKDFLGKKAVFSDNEGGGDDT